MKRRKTPVDDHRPPPERRRARSPARDGAHWLYGVHAATAAARNPERRVRRLAATPDTAPRLAHAATEAGAPRPTVEIVDRRALDSLLPAGAVHQGVAALVEPLDDVAIDDVRDRLGDAPDAVVVVLDQATDPRNVGAILRSAAAFGAAAVVVQDRHAPPATGVLAKAASGALELVPLVRVVNVARALDALKSAGFWCVGLDGDADATLAEAAPTGRIALVLGSEGAGLRRLTRDTCDLLVRIPIAGVDSLNVSAAAAVALYAVAKRGGPPGQSEA